jgi:hypothetical protein
MVSLDVVSRSGVTVCGAWASFAPPDLALCATHCEVNSTLNREHNSEFLSLALSPSSHILNWVSSISTDESGDTPLGPLQILDPVITLKHAPFSKRAVVVRIPGDGEEANPTIAIVAHHRENPAEYTEHTIESS